MNKGSGPGFFFSLNVQINASILHINAKLSKGHPCKREGRERIEPLCQKVTYIPDVCLLLALCILDSQREVHSQRAQETPPRKMQPLHCLRVTKAHETERR